MFLINMYCILRTDFPGFQVRPVWNNEVQFTKAGCQPWFQHFLTFNQFVYIGHIHNETSFLTLASEVILAPDVRRGNIVHHRSGCGADLGTRVPLQLHKLKQKQFQIQRGFSIQSRFILYIYLAEL